MKAFLPLCSFVAVAGLAWAAPDWRPVDPADLALKTPVVDKNADAEAIFWDVWVEDEAGYGTLHSVLSHYIRIKIFTELGKEKFGKVDLPAIGRRRIDNIAARTIQPGGAILEVQKDAIFDRVLAEAGGNKIRAKSFALPGVEPGAIVEYRWRETREDELAHYVRLQFQRDIPIQRVTYHIKPLPISLGMRSLRFHCPNSPFVKERDGFVATTLTNVPAFRHEPDMPPDNQVRAWMLIHYSRDNQVSPEKYWDEYGKQVYRDYKPLLKVDGDVRNATAKAVGNAATDDDKLKRLFEYCRTEIKNTRDRGSGLSAEERSALKPNKTPADTLRQGAGTPLDIDLLFAAMATAAGFDARVAKVADRSDVFERNIPEGYFLSTFDIAVRVNDKWRFFDPSATHLPYGMLRWQEEGYDALISDPKEPTFVTTPLSGPEKSLAQRRGVFKLDAKGNLEGDVTLEFTGHTATARRSRAAGETEEQRIAEIRSYIRSHNKNASISNAKIENLNDPDKPLIQSFHLKVGGYAQRTGKRLFIPLNFFAHGTAARFPTTERVHPVHFDYPWSEADSVTFDLPEGYALDNADIPSSLNFGVGEYKLDAGVTKDRKKLVCSRAFSFGRDGKIFFQPTVYPGLKKAFDAIHERDNHLITLKQADAAPGQ